MRPQRVEIWLDPGTRWKLEEMAAARVLPVSKLVRSLIEHSYKGKVTGTARLAVAEKIGQMEIEDAPKPDELKRQLSSEAHGPGVAL